ncbi:MAG: sodium:proton exchanger [Phycisphaerae bacterium SM23_30]|nr:MAG: sodium:proton exchanger [Phycisphaerae bacterium SM23_30]
MLPYLLMVLGFILLIKGADFLVEGASSIGRKLKISDLAIGLTVVAFGTSMPELFVNIMASIKGNTEIAIGNVLGSNIANIFLILGISAIIYPLSVSRGTVWKEIPFSLLAAVLLGLLVNDRWIDRAGASDLTRIDGMVLLCFFIIFVYYTAGIAQTIDGMAEYVPPKQLSMTRSILYVIGGLIGLGIGGKWIVDGAIHIAGCLGVSESLIGLTIVAVGTSLPELATSAVAAYKKNVEIAVGNVVGSNIFNIFFVLGISATIKPLPFKTSANIDIAAVIGASVLLFIWMFTGQKRRLDRWEGAVFVVLYLSYIIISIVRA